MKNIVFKLFFSTVVILFLSFPGAFAETLHLAVASNFSRAMDDLKIQFEKQIQTKLLISYGSSGKIYAQITHGAPFDIFFSADQAKVEALIENGLAVRESRFSYAQGALVLWSVKAESPESLQTRLHDLQFSHLALANPRLAPYGLAAQQSLEKLGLFNSTRSRWVLGENISQTYQFVVSGHADIGFLALSQVYNENSQTYWRVPQTLYTPIKQDAVLLNKASSSRIAREFMTFVQSEEAKTTIMRYGYELTD